MGFKGVKTIKACFRDERDSRLKRDTEQEKEHARRKKMNQGRCCFLLLPFVMYVGYDFTNYQVLARLNSLNSK